MKQVVSECVVEGFADVVESLRTSLTRTTGEVSTDNAKAVLQLALDAVNNYNGTNVDDAIYAYLSKTELG
ncbi:hypothetical protein H5A44_20895 [Pectobacterium brasiliense]|uniref:hypothetical protein n=1 Tax=Pectobacterium TaxID=122277 RepID=UPI00196A0146|nr:MULTISPECIES: hypothetical protein [Pectobacterium]MBN3344875.1 hypothetical protein [Pectobacterium brasiliense]UFT92858.1 hypothetical protein LQF52_13365 [Pectobacterium carotovorum]